MPITQPKAKSSEASEAVKPRAFSVLPCCIDGEGTQTARTPHRCFGCYRAEESDMITPRMHRSGNNALVHVAILLLLLSTRAIRRRGPRWGSHEDIRVACMPSASRMTWCGIEHSQSQVQRLSSQWSHDIIPQPWANVWRACNTTPEQMCRGGIQVASTYMRT